MDNTKKCETCLQDFIPYNRNAEQQYLCTTCANDSSVSSKAYIKKFYEKQGVVCPCGKLTGNKNKYCSSECKKAAGNYKKPGKTKSAICVGCAEEFTRPISYRSAMKYCSNECSHKETKKVRDKFVMELNEDAIVFHSTWELRFVAACYRYGIPWRRYDGDAIETSVGNYRPDFIVGKQGYVVEIKGHMNYESMIKTEEAKNILGEQYLLVLEKDLIEFENTSNLFGIDLIPDILR